MDNGKNDVFGNIGNQNDPTSRWNPNKTSEEMHEISWGGSGNEAGTDGPVAEGAAEGTMTGAPYGTSTGTTTGTPAGTGDMPYWTGAARSDVPRTDMRENEMSEESASAADEIDDKIYGSRERKRRDGKKDKRKGSFAGAIGKAVACGLVFGIVGGASFTGVNYISKRVFKDDSAVVSEMSEGEKAANVTVAETGSNAGTGSSLNYDVADIVQNTETSIVSITTTVTTSYQYFFQQYERQSTGAGSGIIIGKSDQNLYIATNYHVVENADDINVGFANGQIVKASIVGYDKAEDIAVVKVAFGDIDSATSEVITIAKIGDSETLRVGEPAVAIGNALGYGQSVTVGYISALNRTIENSEETYIQTDAAINPGNSGGALINAAGEVIGINSVKYIDSYVEGMGFAIPINRAMSIIDRIISGKQDKTTYLGISGAAISKEYAQIYGFPEGIYVREVQDNSPASKAGLHAGDIIVEFDGFDSYTMEELQEKIREKGAGDKVEIVVYRADMMGNYQKIKLTAVLEMAE